MSDLPVFTEADIEAAPTLEFDAFSNDDAADLGLLTVRLIRELDLNLAVKIVMHDDIVFVAKLRETGQSTTSGSTTSSARASASAFRRCLFGFARTPANRSAPDRSIRMRRSSTAVRSRFGSAVRSLEHSRSRVKKTSSTTRR